MPSPGPEPAPLQSEKEGGTEAVSRNGSTITDVNAANSCQTLEDDATHPTRSAHYDALQEASGQPSQLGKVESRGRAGDHGTTADDERPEPPYSVLSEPVKATIIIAASFAALISPLSASMYLPALNSIAADLRVSISSVALTITTYMIFQGLAPSVIGNFSDIFGRRPAYIICFTIYLGANIGLALQHHYAALMALRCLQSAGSSGTIALSSAVVADVSTRAQRGKYIGYASMGVTLGPALGPIIGGLLDQSLGWRSIFWFLVIFSAVILGILVVAMPETCRAVVGNGSISPPRWQLSVWQYLRQRGKKSPTVSADVGTVKQGPRSLNPLASLRIAFQKEEGIILWYGSLLYAGYFAVLSTLSPQLQELYGFDSLKIGLCYLPLGVGSLTSRWTVGRILDKNFQRLAHIHKIPIVNNRQQDISSFPIELARLQISIPLIYGACLVIVAYSWVMNFKTNLAGPMVVLFFVGHLVTGAFSALSTLVVDINRGTPATAMAANNLARCLMGAGAVAVANPLIHRIGIGWTGTFIALLWVIFSPALWVVIKFGPQWRARALAGTQAEAAQKLPPTATTDLEAGAGDTHTKPQARTPSMAPPAPEVSTRNGQKLVVRQSGA